MIASILLPNTGPEQLDPPLQMFRFSDLENELAEIRDALPKVSHDIDIPDLDDDDWSEIMNALLAILECETGTPLSEQARTLLATLPATSAKALADKIRSVGPVIDQARLHGNTQFPQTHFLLLPQEYPRRIAHVLGSGQLPLVWVQTLDIPFP